MQPRIAKDPYCTYINGLGVLKILQPRLLADKVRLDPDMSRERLCWAVPSSNELAGRTASNAAPAALHTCWWQL